MELVLGGLGRIFPFAFVCSHRVVYQDDQGDGRYSEQDGNDEAEHDLYLSCFELGTGIEIDRGTE